MSKLLKKLLMVALAVPTLAMAQVNLDKVVATVAGEPVTAQEVQEQISINVAVANQEAGKKLNLTEAQKNDIKQSAFNEIISNRLMLNKAKNLNIGVSDSDINQALNSIAQSQNISVDEFKQNVIKQGGDKGWAALNRDLRMDLIKNTLIKREVEDKVKVSSDEVDAFLAERKLGKNNPIPKTKGVLASDIFIAGADKKAKDKMNAVKARLDAGEAFDAVARSASENQETARNGGKVPFIAFDNSADPAVTKALEGLADGATSGIISTKNGLHIIKVEKRTEIEFGLDEQTKNAKAALMEQKMPEAYNTWLKDLMVSGQSLVEIKK